MSEGAFDERIMSVNSETKRKNHETKKKDSRSYEAFNRPDKTFLTIRHHAVLYLFFFNGDFGSVKNPRYELFIPTVKVLESFDRAFE